MPEWTFITRHAIALSLIARNNRITALELSAEMGTTERAVRKLIAELHAAGYVSKQKEGRGIKYGINRDLPLRHSLVREVAIGDLLESLGRKRPQTPERKRTAKGLPAG